MTNTDFPMLWYQKTCVAGENPKLRFNAAPATLHIFHRCLLLGSAGGHGLRPSIRLVLWGMLL